MEKAPVWELVIANSKKILRFLCLSLPGVWVVTHFLTPILPDPETRISCPVRFAQVWNIPEVMFLPTSDFTGENR